VPWDVGRRYLPEGRYQPGDLLQLKEEFDGMTPPEMRRRKQVEDENTKLRKLVRTQSVFEKGIERTRWRGRGVSG